MRRKLLQPPDLECFWALSPPTNPDFLWSLVGSLHFMRLSLKERRTRGPVQSCVQEIGAPDHLWLGKGKDAGSV
jgi:hypothetical protein